jgi:F0F1-type ATP synthase membrane subunit b/b'
MNYFLIFSFLFFVVQDKDLITASSSVDRNIVRIGDKIIYTIQIEYDQSLQIQTPGEGVNLGYFEVKDYKVYPSKLVGTTVLDKYEYTISTYDTGEYVIPPFPIGYYPKGNSASFRMLEAPEQLLNVESIFLNDSVVKEQPRDIKNPMDVPYTSLLWLWIILGVGLLVAVWFLYKKFFKASNEVKEMIVTPLEAHELALQELAKYRDFASDNLDEIDYYYTRVTFILRQYIEQRFFISAVEETSTELRESLKKISITAKQYDVLVELISSADLVKFAKDMPTKSDCAMLYDSAYEFITNTKLSKAAQPEASHE